MSDLITQVTQVNGKNVLVAEPGHGVLAVVGKHASAKEKEKKAGKSSTKAKVHKSSPSGSSTNEMPKDGYFAILFYLLLDSMQIRQNTTLTQSKEISANSEEQNKLNKQNAAIKFSILPYGASNATINHVQDLNQQYAALRENIQNELITSRQSGQVEMTQASTNVNVMQQDASMDSNWVGTLNTIFQVIDQITQT